MNQEEVLQSARERAHAQVATQIDETTKNMLDQDVARLESEISETQGRLNQISEVLQVVRAARESLNSAPVEAPVEEQPQEVVPEENQG